MVPLTLVIFPFIFILFCHSRLDRESRPSLMYEENLDSRFRGNDNVRVTFNE